jgi:hypothetical protein
MSSRYRKDFHYILERMRGLGRGPAKRIALEIQKRRSRDSKILDWAIKDLELRFTNEGKSPGNGLKESRFN